MFFARSRAAVGVAWQAMSGESKADSSGDAMLSVDIVGQNQDCSELGNDGG